MNEKHKCINLEHLRVDTPYAFSFNPSAQLEQNPVTDCIRLNAVKNWWLDNERLFKSLNHSQVKVLPEMSPKGRWHFHGYLYITNIYKFFLRDMPILQRSGTYEIDTIESIPKWEEYINKQQFVIRAGLREDKCEYQISTYKEKREAVNEGAPRASTEAPGVAVFSLADEQSAELLSSSRFRLYPGFQN